MISNYNFVHVLQHLPLQVVCLVLPPLLLLPVASLALRHLLHQPPRPVEDCSAQRQLQLLLLLVSLVHQLQLLLLAVFSVLQPQRLLLAVFSVLQRQHLREVFSVLQLQHLREVYSAPQLRPPLPVDCLALLL